MIRLSFVCLRFVDGVDNPLGRRTDSIEALEKRGLDTFKELLNREPELLSQYRDVKQAQQESN